MGSHKSQLAFAALISCLLVGPRSSDLTVAAEPVSAAAPVATRAELVAAHDALESKYGEQLAGLASWCESQHLSAQAKQTRAWLPRRAADKLYIFLLPEALAMPVQAAAPPAVDEWWERFVKLRRAQAEALFQLAERALAAHQAPLAYELVRQTVRENPDHARARAILGYERVAGHWVTAYGARRLAAGQVFNAKYGWIAAADVARYDAGRRNNHGVWISSEEDARQHANIKSGWHVETEHYLVTTNHSLEAGVKLAQRLERLNEVWRQVFAGYWLTEAELKKSFDGAPVHRPVHQHQVVYFRDRDEYNTALLPRQALIKMTLGIYMFDTHTCYFFAGEEQNDGTLNHEATHQLFQETRPSARDLGRRNNFWIVEAVACYMESLEMHGDYVTVGGFDEGRIPAARKRLLDDHIYVPLGELVVYGRDALQHDSRLPMIYSESSGLAMFLMQYGGGRYRQPLVEYLQTVYADKSERGTLAKLTGVSYDKLDRQYFDFLKQAPADN
jgi:hypothetical protein